MHHGRRPSHRDGRSPSHRWIIWIWLALSLLGSYYSARLYASLRTNLDVLLPTHARSVEDAERIKESLPGTENLALLVFSSDTKASRRFIDDFAKKATASLGNLITHVDYRIDRELAFFRARQALFLSVQDLEKIRDYIAARILYERELHNPLNIFSGIYLPEPRLELGPIEGRFGSAIVDFTRFPDGYYATPDEKVRAALLFMRGGALSTDQALRLRAGVDRIIAKLNPRSYAPDLKIRFTGDVENLIEERNSLINDLKTTTALVAILVTVAMLVFYRSWRGTVALVTATLAGTLVTLGISWFTQGYLNGNSAFLGSIIIGNGINFGIVLLARYFETRRQAWPGVGHERALAIAMKTTWKATLTAALAAALSYGSLLATEFRGFKQFGAIGLIGMISCWIAAYTLLPALLTEFENHHSLVGENPKPERHRFAALMAWVLDHAAFLLLLASIGGVVLSVIAWREHSGPLIETDTSTLRDRRSMASGSGYYSQYLDKIFGHFVSPVVILADTPEHARELTKRVERIKDSGTQAGKFISSVYSLDSFIPRNQSKKLEVLDQIRTLVPRPLLEELPKNERTRLKELLTPESRRSFGAKDLPPGVRARFREKTGTLGRLVIIEPVIDPVLTHTFAAQKAFIEAVRATADAVHARTPVVGTLPLTVDLVDNVSHDGPRATLYAFLAVALLVMFLFRRPILVLETLGALILGMTWMGGAMLKADIKINFLDFIAIPITIGIGVDYGVNIVQRYRDEGRVNIARVIRGTGAAVALASFTTVIGYSSLLIAGNQGFVSFGRLAVLGEITCLLAALWGLPAYLKLREGKAIGPKRTSLAPPARPTLFSHRFGRRHASRPSRGSR
jgi:predicted RND superfamily exporter protein